MKPSSVAGIVASTAGINRPSSTANSPSAGVLARSATLGSRLPAAGALRAGRVERDGDRVAVRVAGGVDGGDRDRVNAVGAEVRRVAALTGVRRVPVDLTASRQRVCVVRAEGQREAV